MSNFLSDALNYTSGPLRLTWLFPKNGDRWIHWYLSCFREVFLAAVSSRADQDSILLLRQQYPLVTWFQPDLELLFMRTSSSLLKALKILTLGCSFPQVLFAFADALFKLSALIMFLLSFMCIFLYIQTNAYTSLNLLTSVALLEDIFLELEAFIVHRGKKVGELLPPFIFFSSLSFTLNFLLDLIFYSKSKT